jgi:hypothetical protein
VIWSLDAGIVTTHLREVDGLGRADTMLESSTVLDGALAPFVLLSKPLFTVTSDRPGMRESALFMRNNDPTEWVPFFRPSFLPKGKVVRADTTDGYGYLRAGAEGDIELQLSSPHPSSESIADFMAILDSVVVA